MADKISQNKMILNWLLQGKSVNPITALNEFGCFRLASRICDLRKEGHPICGAFAESESGKRYKYYYMNTTIDNRSY